MAKSSSGNPKVDWFFEKEKQWQKECELLREIALSSSLDEVLKWGKPCYVLNGKNIVLIHTFKDYCAYLFFKGALMKDLKGILVQQTQNVQSERQIRFSKLSEISKLKSTIKAYIQEAIEIEKAGKKVAYKSANEFPVAHEFQIQLDTMPALQNAFKALTPGRQKGYLLFFSSAKQAKTRVARVEKCIPLILDGQGLDD